MNIFQKTFSSIKKNYLGLGQSIASWQWQLPGKWSKRQQLEQYNRYVFTIVSAFALDFAKTSYKMMSTIGDKTKELNSHELIDLLESPNPQQSGFQFRELHATYMKLAGESFWYRVNGGISKKPKELYLLRPDLVDIEINKDKTGSIKKYILRLDDGSREEFEPEEIIHHKYPNPMNPWRGMGVIEASMSYLQTEEYASEWTKNSIYNSGRPSGILNLQGKMNDDQFQQLKEKFKQEYTGTTNAGKTLLLKGFDGIDWAKLGMDLEGIDLQKVKDITREDIMFMFRTSNTIMGITDDVNRANSREMRGVWFENVIKPELDRFIDQLNHSLVKPLYRDNLSLEYKDPNPETIQDRVEEWTAGINKWLTTNDIIRERNQIMGTDIPEKEGGDLIWQPLSLTPMEVKKDAEPIIEPEDDEQEEQEEQEDNEQEERSIKSECDCGHTHNVEKSVENPKVEKKLDRYEQAEIMRKNLYKEQERWEQPFKTQVNKVFEKQRSEILNRMKTFKGKELTIKNFEEWFFDELDSKLLWQELILPLATQIVIEQSKHIFDFADDINVIDELELTPNLQNEITSRITRWAFDVDQDTLEAINETITEATIEGESVRQMRDRINNIYDSATDVRSTRIARTETIHLSNLASLEAMQYLPSVVGKEWIANPDACEFCQPLHKQVVQLNTNFVNLGEVVSGLDGGSYVADYEDVEHPPLHPNCRCTIIPVNRDQMKDYKLEQLEKMLYEYKEMDKRTKEAKELLQTMAEEKEELSKGKKELNDTLAKIEELIK